MHWFTAYLTPRGTKQRKVTPDMLARMRTMKAKGSSYVAISRKFGITPPAVRYQLNDSHRVRVLVTAQVARMQERGFRPFQRRKARKNQEKCLRIISRVRIRKNRKAVKDFYNQALARGLAPAGVMKNLYCLLKLSDLLGKSFQKATLKDLERAMASIESSSYAENTKNLYRAVIKSFYGKADPRVSWIRVRGRILNPKLPKELITRQELAYLISRTNSVSKRALLAFLYDSAIRPREFVILRREHIVPDSHGMFVMIPKAKTSARTIYLTESRKWLEHIPFGLDYGGMASFFKRIGKGMDKRLYPYLLRHSRLTELARSGWNQSMLCKFAGWTQGSAMAQVYIHLSDNDLRSMMLRTQEYPGPGFSHPLSPHVHPGMDNNLLAFARSRDR